MNAYDQSWVPEHLSVPKRLRRRLSPDAPAECLELPVLAPPLHLRDFAAAHGKPMAFPEWGLLVRSDGHGGGDNPYFIQKMHDFFMDPANNVVFHAYTNTSRRNTTTAG